jgi:hypothetical protein
MDRKDKLRKFEFVRVFGFAFFFLQNKVFRISMQKEYKLAEELFSGILWGYIGYLVVSLFGMRLIYNRSAYIRDRMLYEHQINFNRESVEELYSEYPFAKANLRTDWSIRSKLRDIKE